MSTKKRILNCLSFILLTFVTSCSENGNYESLSPEVNSNPGIHNTSSEINNSSNGESSNSSDNSSKPVIEQVFGTQTLNSNRNADFEVYMLDMFDIMNDSGTERSNNMLGFLGPVDCYLIKVPGNKEDTDILIDCGFTHGAITAGAFEKVFLPKLCYLVQDGVLDYVITTHGDKDHINGFWGDNCYFDALSTNIYDDKLNPLFDNKKDKHYLSIPRIDTLIDFNSSLTKYYSSEEFSTDPTKWLFPMQGDVYKKYITKRDNLLNKDYRFDTDHKCIDNYFSAASFFSDDSLRNYFGKSSFEEAKNFEREYCKPDNYLKEDFKDKDESNVLVSYSNEEKINGPGHLVRQENTRFALTYDIELKNGVILRILNNWFYRNMKINSWINSSDSFGTIYNNISVCVEVFSNNNKFATFGDLGGAGIQFLNKYYGESDTLNNITVWKASHHGSTNNHETTNLFNGHLDNLKIILSPSILLKQRDMLDQKDPGFSKFMVACMKKRFFDQFKGEYPLIFSPNIVGFGFEGKKTFGVNPLYGDIHVSFENNIINYCYSYGGEVDGYVDIDNPNYKFYTHNKEGKLLDIKKIGWFKKAYGEQK